MAVTSVSGSFRAAVLAARLASEGVDVPVAGTDGPYRLTMGELSRVELLVPEHQLELARLVLLAIEVDDALAEPEEWEDAGPEGHFGHEPSVPARRRWRGVATALLVTLAAGGSAAFWERL